MLDVTTLFFSKFPFSYKGYLPTTELNQALKGIDKNTANGAALKTGK